MVFVMYSNCPFLFNLANLVDHFQHLRSANLPVAFLFGKSWNIIGQDAGIHADSFFFPSQNSRASDHSWCLSRAVRNRLATCFRGKEAKARKDLEKTSRWGRNVQIGSQNSIPDAAVIRMQLRLFEGDWKVPIRTSIELSSADGIAIVTEPQQANVLRQVGYTRTSPGIITTLSASQLYLKG